MRRGQALLEYVIAFAFLSVAVLILWGLVEVSVRYGERAENLVSSDYP